MLMNFMSCNQIIMKNDEMLDKLILDSTKAYTWQNELEMQDDSSEWLDFSFKIAVKIQSEMKRVEMSQKTLSDKLECSAQYVSKLLKGRENLTISTIFKIQSVLGIHLISTFDFEYQDKVSSSDYLFINHSFVQVRDSENISVSLNDGGFSNCKDAA